MYSLTVKVLVKIILRTVLQQNTEKQLLFVQHCINEVMKNVEYLKEGVFVPQKDSRTTYICRKALKNKGKKASSLTGDAGQVIEAIY